MSGVSRRAAIGLLLGVLAGSLFGFIEIHDEVTVKGSGGAVVLRTVHSPALADIEEFVRQLEERDPDPDRARLHADLNRSLRAMLEQAMAGVAGEWDSIKLNGADLILKKRFSKKLSPFSSAGQGYASFALHHFLSTPITRPPFPLIGLGPVQRDDPQHRAFIEDLKKRGLRMDLTIRMPGTIDFLWGKNGRWEDPVVFVDLLDPWPEDRQETFLLSSPGLLHSEGFHWLLIGFAFLIFFFWMRWLRR